MAKISKRHGIVMILLFVTLSPLFSETLFKTRENEPVLQILDKHLSFTWTTQNIGNLAYGDNGTSIVIHILNDKMNPKIINHIFGLDLKTVDASITDGSIFIHTTTTDKGSRLLFIAAKDSATIIDGLSNNTELRDSIVWVSNNDTTILRSRPVDQPLSYTEKRGVFNYSRTGYRGWTDDEMLDLLEKAYVWYIDFFGTTPTSSVKVFDRAPSKDDEKKWQTTTAWYTISNRAVTLNFRLPDDFGLTYFDISRGRHYYAHELLHNWFPAQTSYYLYCEPLTQFLAQRFLLNNGYITQSYYDYFIERLAVRATDEFNKYLYTTIVKLDKLWNSDKDACIDILKKASVALVKDSTSIKKIMKDAFGE